MFQVSAWKKFDIVAWINIFMPLRPQLAGGIERSGCPYFRPSIDQVKIFVQGRISRPINGSKLIFHMRMYLHETSRNIQEPWPTFYGPLTLDFGQIIKVVSSPELKLICELIG